MSNWEQKTNARPVTWIILGVIGIFVFIWLLAFAAFGIRVATAGIVGAGKARIQIQSAPSRISAYNHFFNLCASVQSNEARVDELETVIDSITTVAEKERLAISLGGVKALRREGIRQYNADARKDYTIGQFRDSDLPYQISDSEYKKGDKKTSCGSE